MKKWFMLLILISIFTYSCKKQETAVPITPESAKLPVAESADAEKKDDIRMLWFNSPPHIYVDANGKLTGAIYDFIQEGIAPEMGVTFSWEEESTSIPREIEILKSGGRVALSLLSITEERASQMYFTESPYFENPPALAVLKSNPLNRIESVEDLFNLKIGYADGGFLSPMMRNEKLDLDLTSNSDYHQTNLKKLDLGRVDAVYGPGKITLALNVQELNLGDRVKLLDLPDEKSTYYIVFPKSEPELVENYNAAFGKIDGKQFYLEKLSAYIDPDLLR